MKKKNQSTYEHVGQQQPQQTAVGWETDLEVVS